MSVVDGDVELEDEDETYDEEIELEFDDDILLALSKLEGFVLEVESPPEKTTRYRGPAKVVTPWEEMLVPLHANPGVTVKMFQFSGEDAPKAARQRARSMRSRLIDTQPHEIWDIVAYDVKDGTWKIFVTYVRPATEDEIVTRDENRLARIERGKVAGAARAAKFAEKKAAAAK